LLQRSSTGDLQPLVEVRIFTSLLPKDHKLFKIFHFWSKLFLHIEVHTFWRRMSVMRAFAVKGKDIFKANGQVLPQNHSTSMNTPVDTYEMVEQDLAAAVHGGDTQTVKNHI
jgi:hypothetical protein